MTQSAEINTSVSRDVKGKKKKEKHVIQEMIADSFQNLMGINTSEVL